MSTLVRRVVLLCFFVSGATGLIYEVIWARYLAGFIGGTAVAHAIVLSTFMGGLALGNACFGRWVDRSVNTLRLYAFLEFGIGALCLGFPEFFDFLSRSYVAVAAGGAPGTTTLLLLKSLFAIVAILPACFLIGGTLPVLAKAIVSQLSQVGTRIGQMYAINTGGALLGIFLAGFYLVEQAGMAMSMRLAALTNVLIGVVFWWLARAEGAAAAPPGEGAGDPVIEYSDREIRLVVILAGVSGLLTMVLEVVWIRMIAVVMGSSTYSFSTMLLGFIGGLALGSLIVSWIMRRDRDAVPVLTATLAGVAVALMAVIPFFEQLPYYFNLLNAAFSDRSGSFGLYLFSQVGLIMALTLVPTTLIGMALPLATRIATRRIGALGSSVGSVFSVNTLGTLLGAALGALVLIPNWGLDAGYRFASLGFALLALILHLGSGRVHSVKNKGLAITGGVLLLSLTLAMPEWDKRVLTSGVIRLRTARVAPSFDEFYERFTRRKLIFYEDGLNDTVTVFQTPDSAQLNLSTNGKTDASDYADMMTQRMLGHLGMMLRPQSTQVMVIGLGSGVTAASIRTHPNTTVDVVEISSAVARASRFFDHVSRSVLDDPKVTLHLTDAKDFLRLQPNRQWEVIVSQPPNPWVAGVGNLFTLDYWQDVQDHLVDDGILIQWIHTYDMDDELLNLTLQTFGKAFPYASLWEIDRHDLVVLGSKRPLSPNFEAMEKRFELQSVADELTDTEYQFRIAGVPGILAMQIVTEALFRAHFPGRGDLNTDDHPRLEFLAPRALFRGDVATLPYALDVRRRSWAPDRLLDRYRAERGPLSNSRRLALGQTYTDMRSPLSDSQRKSLSWDAYIRGGPLAQSYRAAGIAPPPALPQFPKEAEKLLPFCATALAPSVMSVNTLSGVFHQPRGTAPARLIQACTASPEAIESAVRDYRVPPQALAESLLRIGAPQKALTVLRPCTGHPLCHVYRVRALTQLQQNIQAQKALARALTQYPDNVELRYLQALTRTAPANN